MRCSVRWLIRISLGFLVILGVAIAGLSIWTRTNPAAVVVYLAYLIQPFISNTHPPPILEDQLAGHGEESNSDASRRLTAFLQRRFPTGTSEGTLKSTLLDQGFSPYREGGYDPNKTFEYMWGRLPCGASLTVSWTADDSGKIDKVTSAYRSVCW
jgi:hypothetical protein